MRKIGIFPFLLLFFILILSCATTDPTLKENSTDEFDQVETAIDKLKDSYEREDTTTFMKGVGPDYEMDYEGLEWAVEDELDRFNSFNLRIYVDRVSVDSDTDFVFADTHWDKKRVSSRTGKESTISGRTTFIFKTLPGGKLVLRGMKGDRVFGGD
jgi:hypothetical protein